MSNLDKVAAAIRSRYPSFDAISASGIAQALEGSGLLAPGPQIVRDCEDLNQHEPDALVLDGYGDFISVEGLAEYVNDRPQAGEDSFPAAVVATGEQVRAAREALEEQESEGV